MPTSRGSILNRDGLFEMSRKVAGIAACYRVWDSGAFQILPCLAPEAIWSESLEDNYTALLWLARNGRDRCLCSLRHPAQPE